MEIKRGVSINGIQPELVLGLVIAQSVYAEFAQNLRLTSCCEGVHSLTSLHYVGFAGDLGIRGIPQHIVSQIVQRLKERLNDEFDVILEADHIHFEYQPKRAK